jgi:hypothetical protein
MAIIKIAGFKGKYGALFSRAVKDKVFVQFFLGHDPSPPLLIGCTVGTGK